MSERKKLLVVDVAALGWNLVTQKPPAGFTFQKASPVFPAVTCVAQASFRTAALPAQHGLVSNGLYVPELKKVLFWEQSAALVEGPRIWDRLRARGGRVGMLFWQQSLGESVDLVLSPRPIHKHEGGMIQDCLCQPAPLYDRLCREIGKPFNLMHYWGPLASRKSSDWIVSATCAVMARLISRPSCCSPTCRTSTTTCSGTGRTIARPGARAPRYTKCWPCCAWPRSRTATTG